MVTFLCLGVAAGAVICASEFIHILVVLTFHLPFLLSTLLRLCSLWIISVPMATTSVMLMGM